MRGYKRFISLILKAMRKLSETKRTIDESQAKLNKRYDELRQILKTFEAYGITDKDFEDFQGYKYAAANNLAASLEKAKQQDIDEALDLCEILDSVQQPSRWRFRRKPNDATTEALIKQLKLKYCAIVG